MKSYGSSLNSRQAYGRRSGLSAILREQQSKAKLRSSVQDAIKWRRNAASLIRHCLEGGQNRRTRVTSATEGFRGIDTAINAALQRGKNWAGAAESHRRGRGERSEVFVQSKFTAARPPPGQEPYSVSSRSPSSSSSQAETKHGIFASSLRHLQTNWIPTSSIDEARQDLANADLGAWRALEALMRRGRLGRWSE